MAIAGKDTNPSKAVFSWKSPLHSQPCPVFQLDYKVGWKKLKEVFSMAGVVVRADILEDKDGKSRGIGTVTFEQAIEAVQAICILGSPLGNSAGPGWKLDSRGGDCHGWWVGNGRKSETETKFRLEGVVAVCSASLAKEILFPTWMNVLLSQISFCLSCN